MGGTLFLNSAFWKFIIVIRKARTRFTYKLFLTLPPVETNIWTFYSKIATYFFEIVTSAPLLSYESKKGVSSQWHRTSRIQHRESCLLPALSRACPELAIALSPFGYAQGKLRRRGSRMDLPSTTSRNIKPYLALQGIMYYAAICHPSSISPLTIHRLTTHHLTRIRYRESIILSSLFCLPSSAFCLLSSVFSLARVEFSFLEIHNYHT